MVKYLKVVKFVSTSPKVEVEHLPVEEVMAVAEIVHPEAVDLVVVAKEDIAEVVVIVTVTVMEEDPGQEMMVENHVTIADTIAEKLLSQVMEGVVVIKVDRAEEPAEINQDTLSSGITNAKIR